MGYHTIPAGAFFTNSPKIRIRQTPTVEDTVGEALRWIEQHGGKGGKINCQLRPASDEERDGHLDRLIGVKRMHAMLLELRGKTDYWLMFYKKEKRWEFGDNDHPCGMLSFNDKWWMSHRDEFHRRKEDEGCFPVELRQGKEHRFSVAGCKYCNGKYDNTIQLALGPERARSST